MYWLKVLVFSLNYFYFIHRKIAALTHKKIMPMFDYVVRFSDARRVSPSIQVKYSDEQQSDFPQSMWTGDEIGNITNACESSHRNFENFTSSRTTKYLCLCQSCRGRTIQNKAKAEY